MLGDRPKTYGNPDKCFAKQEKIRFYSIVYGKDGIQPDPDKVLVLKHMSAPTTQQELQTLRHGKLHGSIHPRHKCTGSPTERAMKGNYQFHWSPAHQEAYNKVKDLLSNEVTLTYFDPEKEITLPVDT